MHYAKLGSLTVSRLGLGCMGMYHLHTGHSSDDDRFIWIIHRALDLGATHIDKAELYGPFTDEELVGQALRGRRDSVVLASKFSLMSHLGGTTVDSPPANIRIALEGSLRRLRTYYIDLYFQHRVDPPIPIEEVVGTLKELIDEEKIRHLGLSEAGQDTIRRAHAVHSIAALQSEYFLWTRNGSNGTITLLKELGIGFAPYSPLNRGLLTGFLRSRDDLDEGDWRITNPRFLPGAFEHSLAIVDTVADIGHEVGATPAQVALAWSFAQDDDWSPIPGTTGIDHLEENWGALEVKLSAVQLERLSSITPAVGDDHTEEQLKLLDR